MAVENPFGHLPATQYGSLPFYSVTCFAYFVCLVIWGMWCISYSKEIMSVQLIIMVVLISFVESDLSGRLQHHRQQRLRARAALHPRRLHHARAHSHSHASRLHGVALLPCIDRRLGVCRATLGNSTCKFAVFGVSYFAITFWDAYSNMYPSNNSNADVIRLLVTSG